MLREGAAASFMFEDRGARMVAGQFGQVRSALDIFVKDMGLVNAAADEAGALVPLTAVARQLYARGHELGLGRLDDSAVIEVLRAAPRSGPRLSQSRRLGRTRSRTAVPGRAWAHEARSSGTTTAITG